MHCVRAAASRTFCTAGTSKAMRMAMMAMTTSNSINVKADRFGTMSAPSAGMAVAALNMEDEENLGSRLNGASRAVKNKRRKKKVARAGAPAEGRGCPSLALRLGPWDAG